MAFALIMEWSGIFMMGGGLVGAGISAGTAGNAQCKLAKSVDAYHQKINTLTGQYNNLISNLKKGEIGELQGIMTAFSTLEKYRTDTIEAKKIFNTKRILFQVIMSTTIIALFFMLMLKKVLKKPPTLKKMGIPHKLNVKKIGKDTRVKPSSKSQSHKTIFQL